MIPARYTKLQEAHNQYMKHMTHHSVNQLFATLCTMHQHDEISDDDACDIVFKIINGISDKALDYLHFTHIQYIVDQNWVRPGAHINVQMHLYWLSKYGHLEKDTAKIDKIMEDIGLYTSNISRSCIRAIPKEQWYAWLDNVQANRYIGRILHQGLLEHDIGRNILFSRAVTKEQWQMQAQCDPETIVKYIQVMNSAFPVVATLYACRHNRKSVPEVVAALLRKVEDTPQETFVHQGLVIGEEMYKKYYANIDARDVPIFDIPQTYEGYRKSVQALLDVMDASTADDAWTAMFAWMQTSMIPAEDIEIPHEQTTTYSP